MCQLLYDHIWTANANRYKNKPRMDAEEVAQQKMTAKTAKDRAKDKEKIAAEDEKSAMKTVRMRASAIACSDMQART